MQTNELRVFYTGAVEPSFIAYQYTQADTHAIFLEELTGWDEDATFSVETEQKMVGAGSYVVSTQISERILEITLNTLFSTELELRLFRENIVSQMISVEPITLNRVFNDSFATWTEQLTGLITSLSAWEQTGLNCSMRFSVLCTEPTIVTL